MKTVRPAIGVRVSVKSESATADAFRIHPDESLTLQISTDTALIMVLRGTVKVAGDGVFTRLVEGSELVLRDLGSRHLEGLSVVEPIVAVVQFDAAAQPDTSLIAELRRRAVRAMGLTRGPGSLEPPVVICEIGCNHRGEFETAVEMIRVAVEFCKVSAVKFQKRTPSLLLSKTEYEAPHPNPHNAYGPTYGLHREFLELDVARHRQLMAECERLGVLYSSSVWDLQSAQEIASLQPKLIKVPSAINTDETVLRWLFDNYSGDIHVSLGMTLDRERERLMELAREHQRVSDLVLYHCTSGYPVPAADVYLCEISRLKREYGSDVKAIGFSGHHNGISVDIAAYTLGADYIERHFTLDRTWKGTDHAASLEPGGMRKLVRNLNEAKSALQHKRSELCSLEIPQREKLKRVVAASADVGEGRAMEKDHD